MFRSGGPVAAVVLIALSLSGSASGSPPSGPAIVFVRANDLFAVSLNGRVVRLTRTRTREVTPAVSFDGTRIAFSRYFGGISVLRVRDRRAEIWTRAGSMPAWAPDGRTIYLSVTIPPATPLAVRYTRSRQEASGGSRG